MPSPQTELARAIATEAHDGQTDQIGAPYILHPAMVVRFVEALPEYRAADGQIQDDTVAAAWLHDVVEDTSETAEGLRAAGISERAVSTVIALTRTTEVAPDDYYATIKALPIARLVKTADLASNLAPERVGKLDATTRDRLALRYAHALDQLGVERSVIDGLHQGGLDSRDGYLDTAGRATKIDLHTHSNRSDGTDTPRDLIRKAKAAGLTVVALTDHDTTVGWAEAADAAIEFGIELVRGIELSVEDGGRGQHLLAYEPDPDNAELREMLTRSVEARDERIPALVAKIAPFVPALRLEDVMAIAGNAIPGRPHVADVLVQCGAVPDRASAFATYLVPGCPTYLETWSPPIEDAIRILAAAGGATVIAHPWGRKSTVSLERFRQLQAVGLSGIEVDHQEHDEETRRVLRGIAVDLGLIITGSSDNHGSRKPNHDLGCNTTAPEEFDRLKRAWASASAVA